MTHDESRPERWLAPQRPAGEQTFVGRENEQGRLVRALAAGYSAALLGRGGIGKTSLLRAIERTLAKASAGPVVYVRAERGDTALALGKSVVDAVARACRPSARGRRTAEALSDRGQLKEAFTTLAGAAAQAGRPIVLLDDAHRLSPRDRGDFWSTVNPVVDHGVAAFLIAGRPPLWDEAHGQASVCWDLLQPKVTLRPFTIEETRALYERAAALGLAVSPGAVEEAHRQSDGDPYALCQVLYRHALDGTPLTPASVASVGSLPDVLQAIADRRREGSTGAAARGEPSAPRPRRIFLHYAPGDVALAQALRSHFRALKQQAHVSDAVDVLAGAEIEAELRERIRSADVVLALLSADYFASEVCREDLAFAQERAKVGGASVVPVLIRPVRWEDTELGGLKPLPANREPVTLWDSQDAAWQSVVSDVMALLTASS